MIEKIAEPDFTELRTAMDLSWSAVFHAYTQVQRIGKAPRKLHVSKTIHEIGAGLSIVSGLHDEGKNVWLVIRPDYPDDWWCVSSEDMRAAVGSKGA